MIYQALLAVTAVALLFALMWGGGVYFEREEAREETNQLREDLKELDESREMWRGRVHTLEDGMKEWRRGVAEGLSLVEAERDEWVRKADDFKRCFESAEKERDVYKRAKAENDERFMIERDEARAERDKVREQYTEALSKITDLDNLVCRIENVPTLDDVKGSYRLTAVRGPYKKTRERIARRAARATRRKATAS